MKLAVHWDHGLGDTVHFAYMLPLWARRNHEIEIRCSGDKACLFQAAGVKVVEYHDVSHAWLHPPKRQTLLQAFMQCIE